MTLLLAGTAAGAADCLPDVSVPITVRIGEGPPVAALLEGGIETPLSLFDAVSGRLLWSAAAHSSAVQVFSGMDAAFTGSLAAIDLDADGVHDRIYAGDMSARLWRFDLQHAAAATEWAIGGVFGDFSNTQGRSFLAAPDISLSAPPGMSAWLNIAIGTAAPGNPVANNRFYALRDHALEPWDAGQYEEWQPWREDDLERVSATVQAIDDAASIMDPGSPGWYAELGSGHVIVPSLTVNHRAVLVIASAVPQIGGPCEIFARIATFDLGQQSIVPASSTGEWQVPLPRPVSAATNFSISAVQEGTATCTLGGQWVPACDVDTRPRKTWWRRTDAE